ncbi:MAG: hypothetical protein U0228_36700 [Myxococcaceae bacterium]
MRSFGVLVVVMTAGSALAQDFPEFADAKTIEQCVKLYRSEKKQAPTAVVRGLSTEAADCTRRVMNARLDVLLVPWKKSDATKFKQGMEAQKLFNQAVKGYCSRWERWYADCCSTCSYTEEPECEMDFHAARFAQVDAVLSKKPLADAPAPTRARTQDFAAFAKAWCALLAEGEGCEARVLGGLEAGQRDDGRELSCRRK